MRKSGLKNAAVFAAAFILAFVCSGSALALDATSFDPRNVSVEANAISGVPVGTIITWPVATNPEGWDEGKWLECNGQTISQTVYPVLFALVGSHVPELRGRSVSYSGTNTPGQVATDNKGWLRIMWDTWSAGSDNEFAYVFNLKPYYGGFSSSATPLGNNVYKHHFVVGGQDNAQDTTTLWFPVGGTGAETMEVRYLMRALP